MFFCCCFWRVPTFLAWFCHKEKKKTMRSETLALKLQMRKPNSRFFVEYCVNLFLKRVNFQSFTPFVCHSSPAWLIPSGEQEFKWHNSRGHKGIVINSWKSISPKQEPLIAGYHKPSNHDNTVTHWDGNELRHWSIISLSNRKKPFSS